MRFLLILLICTSTFSVVFNNGLTLAPGLSAKNGVAYLAALMLLFQIALGRRLKFDFTGLHIAFCTLILYGFVSLLYVAEVVQPERYNLIASGIVLKSSLMDWAVVFAVYFYGTRTADDVELLIKTLLIAVGISNIYTLAVLAGFPVVGAEVVGSETGARRVNGVFGHANETGTLIAALLPAFIAVAEGSRGYRKLLWIGLLMISVVVMFTTASRGALVALFLGSVVAAFMCRRYLSWERTIKWLMISGAILVPVTIAVGVKYWDMVVGRFTKVQVGVASDLSSGRTDIWLSALNKMLAQPITLITGQGWNIWPLSGFAFVAHNQYISLWFELGAIGCLCLMALLKQATTNAASTLPLADERGRRYLIACVFGALIWATGLLFGTMFIPWFFIWAYLSLSMRYASLWRNAGKEEVPASVAAAPSPVAPPATVRPRRNRAAAGVAPKPRKTVLARSSRTFE
jgi:hypothetical protein